MAVRLPVSYMQRYFDLTVEYRNTEASMQGFLPMALAASGSFGLVAVAAGVEMVARVLLYPFCHTLLLLKKFSATSLREEYTKNVLSPLREGIYHNFYLTCISFGCMAASPLRKEFKPESVVHFLFGVQASVAP